MINLIAWVFVGFYFSFNRYYYYFSNGNLAYKKISSPCDGVFQHCPALPQP